MEGSAGAERFGEGIFFEKFLAHVKAHEDTKEIPRRQRYANRPALSTILANGEHSAKQIRKAVTDYVYRQKEVAEFLGVHYSTISRWVSKTSNARIKT